jgi:hypothetical protein
MANRKKHPSKVGDADELERLRAENKSLKKFGVYSGISKVLCEIVRSARMIGPLYFIHLCIRDWPKHSLRADVKGSLTVESDSITEALSGVLNETVLAILFAILIAGAIAYGKYQAKLRRDDVERLSRYKEDYERLVDPKRSSSRLTARGDTRPEDE